MEQLRNRRQALGVMAAASLASLSTQAWAQASGWKPTERVSYILGVSPGGSVDIYARGVQEALTQMNLLNGQTMIIDYKPGGAGTISLQALAKTAGTGLGLGTFHTSTLVAIGAGILKADLRDNPPVAMLVEETQMVAVRADSSIRNGQDLVATLRKIPQRSRSVWRLHWARAPTCRLPSRSRKLASTSDSSPWPPSRLPAKAWLPCLADTLT